MNITKFKASDLVAVNGNSLTIFIDINDGVLKAKDVRGNVYTLESLSAKLEGAQSVFVDPQENILKYLREPELTERLTSKQLNLGWARYDDTQYNENFKLTLNNGQLVDLPNNAGRIFTSYEGVSYYNPISNRILSDNVNDTYALTVTFKASAANANSTHLDFLLTGGDYERISKSISFYKANDTEQNFHDVYQYYTDLDFVQNGAGIKIMSDGGESKIWDVIFFIQKIQTHTA